MLDVRTNYAWGFNNLNCLLGCSQIDNQIHVFTNCPKVSTVNTTGSYKYIFGTLFEQEEIASKFIKIELLKLIDLENYFSIDWGLLFFLTYIVSHLSFLWIWVYNLRARLEGLDI